MSVMIITIMTLEKARLQDLFGLFNHSKQTFLDGGSDQYPITGIKLASGQSSCSAGRYRFARIKQPLIYAKRPMQPQAMIQTGNL